MVGIEVPPLLREYVNRDAPLAFRLPAAAIDRSQWFWIPLAVGAYAAAGYMLLGGALGLVRVDTLGLAFALVLPIAATLVLASCAYNVWGCEELQLSAAELVQTRRVGGWRRRRVLPRPSAASCTYHRAYVNDGLPGEVGPWLELKVINSATDAKPTAISIGRGLKLEPPTLEALRTVLESWAAQATPGGTASP